MKRKPVSLTLLLVLLFTLTTAGICQAAALDTSVTVTPNVTTTIKPPDSTIVIVAPPANLTASALSSSEVKLDWQDKSSGVSRFQVERKAAGESYLLIASTVEGTTSFTDTGLSAGTTYSYRVKAYTRASQSAYSNEVSVTTPKTVVTKLPDQLQTELKPMLPPQAPTDLTATAVSTSLIDLSWKDQSTNETGFKVERKAEGGSYTVLASVGANYTTLSDNFGIVPDTTYYYRVKAYNSVGDSAYSNEVSVKQTVAAKTVIEYVVGSTEYKVNGQTKSMDAAPVMVEGRVFLPLRYVVEPLGATLNWDAAAQKITIVLGGKTIELWIGQNTATVNGVQELIDPANPNVVPFVSQEGRTMVPVRFVSQALGCDVAWDMALQKVTVTYPKN